jgi:hypothetical protein
MITPALRWSLVLPPLVPIAIVLATYGAGAAGHKWNVHGDLLGMFFWLLTSLVLGGVVVILALLKAVPTIARHREARTPGNVACAGIGLAFVLGCLGVAVWWFA